MFVQGGIGSRSTSGISIHTHPASGEFVLEEGKDRPLCRPASDGGLEKWPGDKKVECGHKKKMRSTSSSQLCKCRNSELTTLCSIMCNVPLFKEHMGEAL